jgi:zinc protease
MRVPINDIPKRLPRTTIDRTMRTSFLCVLALAGATKFAFAQGNPRANKAASAQEEKEGGTGIVPSGVKLVPTMPPAGSRRPFEFPNAAAKTLSNGLRVFVVSDHKEPAVAARLLIMSAGSIKDPQDRPGVAEMTANLLTQGAAKRSARDIADAIDLVGGSLSASAGKDGTTVTLDIVKKDLDLGLDLMSDVVLHPTFQNEELDRQRQQLLSGLTVQYSDPQYLASAVFSRLVYGKSPYGWPGEGTPETVQKLNRDQLAQFQGANYVPNQSFLAFAGDITPEQAFAAAEKYFGGWERKDVSASSPVLPSSLSGRHIWLIDKPDAVQTQIRVGKLGIRRGDPDYIPVEVMNRIFGGGYNSLLNTEVRVKKGLTYGAYSQFTPHLYTGAFFVGTFTRTEATVEATKLVIDLLSKMSAGGVRQQQLNFARDYLAGVYPIQSETAEQVADRVLTAAIFDLAPDYNRTYPDKIRAVTSAQVDEMAKRYLSTDDLDIVLVGNVTAFRDALKKEFPQAAFDEIPFDQVDILAPDLRKLKTVEAAATPESLEQGRQILLAAANAAGGDALTLVKSLQMTENGKQPGRNGEVSITVKWTVAYPDRSHGDVSYGGQAVTQICDGKSAWIVMGPQSRDVSGAIREFERGIALFGGGWGLYQQVLAGKINGQSIGEVEIDGKKTAGVAVQTVFGNVKLFFDPATHLLAAARFQSASPQGIEESEQRWSDYRPVDGGQFAFSMVAYRGGAKFMESTVSDVKLNPPVDQSLFAKPEAAPAK